MAKNSSILSFWRPLWPEYQRWDGFMTRKLRVMWRFAAVIYTVCSMIAIYLTKRIFQPVHKLLSGLARGAGKLLMGSGWIACLQSIGGCFLFSVGFLSDLLITQSNSPLVSNIFAGLLGFLLLGCFRWSTLNLMEQETEYSSYDTLSGRFTKGVFGILAAELPRPADIIWIRHLMVTSIVHLLPTIALVVWGTQTWFVWAWFAVTIFATVKTPSLNHNFGHHRPFSRLTRTHPLLGRGLLLWYSYVVEFAEGDVPNLTIAGHNLVHHAENNGPDDFESTYPYDRTSFTDTSLLYLNCMISYSFSAGILDYLWRRKAKQAYRYAFLNVIAGLCFAYGILLLIALFVSPQIALFMLVVRLVQSGLKFGQGAYVTHPFVDPENPQNCYKNCLDFAVKGTQTHGGGIHILHHLRPIIHWSDLKQQRSAAVSEYDRNKAIVIPLEAGSYLQPLMFAKRFNLLARLVLDVTEIDLYEKGHLTLQDMMRSPSDTKELAHLLEYRAKPKHCPPSGRVAGLLDTIAASLMLKSAISRSALKLNISEESQ